MGRTARHETQHIGQYLLRELKDLDELGGLPPGEVRDPKWNEWGSTPGSRYQRDHAFRDVEFQTRLADEVDVFTSVAERIPGHMRRAAMRVWMADPQEGDEDTAEQINATLDLDRSKQVERRDFFRALKRSEFEKWKQAAKTFVSKVNERLDIPGER